ncbi:uncharacterized protein LOC117180100 [Belonocnema kinseyi]|uniref:uncharacterized protein LOC117180100 n=1 Tax=Belonocnema kinseyi TaxID=2817044 RepID=UPI00143CD334|nr:uncharacterized protein LOC117180100 [Belonocnema kinseyi]XP_033228312.1 uncharacterized protein LOC117180100 [Belonocnema kinseyi]XP_033228313.1 uncharacterized protein LOC117180100 [Belonocnema kinseyi]
MEVQAACQNTKENDCSSLLTLLSSVHQRKPKTKKKKKEKDKTKVDNGINSEFSQEENVDETEEPECAINVNKGSDDIKKLEYRIEHMEEETVKLGSEIKEKDNIIKKQKERIMKERKRFGELEKHIEGYRKRIEDLEEVLKEKNDN